MSDFNAQPLERLINNFQKLSGVGRKGATRMAYQILSMDKADAQEFSDAILAVHSQIHRCPVCQNFTEKDVCKICDSQNRDKSVICIVESPRDVTTFEKTREYKGTYHVLHGLISPLDGIGVDQLTVKELLSRLNDDTVKEVIMATNPTVEGEATAMYLSRIIKPLGIKVTRLAYGLPVGSSLEFADEVTLFRALKGRTEI
ncbi:MAG: recombination protein RecR [Oscillospiraceae bacterium]|nr:recombination protein RecR [Oscillospiraceae bacterium]MBQ5313291.1 recombination protein RecR [Oscillospiraceae bacterium]MBQ7006439.1 recombination protein RecR [Oscillospiraceae bacterium]